MKKLWSGIKSIVNISDNKTGINISHLLQDGKEIDDPQKMANTFNNFLLMFQRKSPLDYLTHSTDKSFFLSPIAPEEVGCLINSLQEVRLLALTVYQSNY